MQKIAILSDIHGNIAALEHVTADIRARGVDCVFNLGDHVSGPLWAKETVQFLMQQDWVHVRGNHERQLTIEDPKTHGLSDAYAYQQLSAAELDWLRNLPASVAVGDEFVLFHGAPAADTTYLLETVEHGRVRLATRAEIAARLGETRAPVLLCGHTHVPRIVQGDDNVLIVNPGSVGLQAFDDNSPQYHVVENGSPHARYAILARSAHGWRAEIIAVAYDHQKAAAQSRKNGRLDWEAALLSGFMQPKL